MFFKELSNTKEEIGIIRNSFITPYLENLKKMDILF